MLLKLHARADLLLPEAARAATRPRPAETLKAALARRRAQAPAAASRSPPGSRQLERFECRRGAAPRSDRSCSTSPTATRSRPRRSSRPASARALPPRGSAERCGALAFDATTTICSRFLFEHFPRGTGFPESPARRRCRPICRLPRARPSASTTRPPPRSTTPFRSRRSPRRGCASASTSPRRRSASRPARALDAMAARAAVDRLHARAQVHDAAATP